MVAPGGQPKAEQQADQHHERQGRGDGRAVLKWQKMAHTNEEAGGLHHLLDGLHAEAEFDSPGGFTVALDEAVAKYRSMAGAEPTRWMLYVLQAAVAWGALGVDLRLEADLSEMVVRFPEGAAAELQRGDVLFSQAPAPGSGGELLRLALLWGRALEPKRLEAAFAWSGGGWRTELVGAEGKREEAAAQPVTTLKLTWRSGTRASSTQLQGMVQTLERRVQFAPVPLHCNGRCLNRGVLFLDDLEGGLACRIVLPADGDGALLSVVTPLRMPALVYAAGQQEFIRGRVGQPFPRLELLEVAGLLSPEMTLEHGSGLPPSHALVLGRWGVEEKSDAVWLTHAGARASALESQLLCRAWFFRTRADASQLFVVHRGCTLQPVALDAPGLKGWNAVVAADSLLTDLSGLALVHNDRLASLCGWAQGQCARVHARMARVAPGLL